VIALVDYGAGNLTSVRKALTAVGATFWTPATAQELDQATGIIVPGVGHFSSTARLDAPWRVAISDAVARSVPLLGICVGLQWLFEGSVEAPDVPGLGLLPGVCDRLGDESADSQLSPSPALRQASPTLDSRLPTPDSRLRLKVPHVGWNSLQLSHVGRLLEGVPNDAQVYFTHSYAAPVVPATAAATTYGVTFSAAVEDGVVSGVQFHPEKSGHVGLRILRNWTAAVPSFVPFVPPS
jgi:glutamine amidotransferase